MYKLIKLKDKFKLVSDEEIKEGDCIMAISGIGFTLYTSFIAKNENDGTKGWNDVHCKKIIAGIPELPIVDLSDFKKEDCETIGWVDVEKLAIRRWDKILATKGHRIGFIDGFKTAQSLNDKMFSLKQMKEAIAESWNSCEDNEDGETFTQCFNRIIQSLQQTSWNVEVETWTMNEGYTDKDDFPYQECKIPKITNNSIRVVKIL